MQKIGESYIQTDDGERILIYEYQEYIDAGISATGRNKIPGHKGLFTSDRRRVMYRGNGIYEIFGEGIRGRKVEK
ncbi:MAG TPA: hypothetical protein PKM59_04820 [Thermodesulfobacteriota bacterium]|nr:hypothetical protein [Thermodesulfobacteriota bacterium]HNU70403.1 hypothetical protein [Thermodesulfobacteriota bacterium]